MCVDGKVAFQSFINLLLTVCRWHCMICSISLLLASTLPSLLLYVDLQLHYHSTGDASSVLHTNTCLVFLSSSSSILSPRSLSFPQSIHWMDGSFHPSILSLHLHACCLKTQYFLLLSFHLFSFYPALSISPLLHHSFQCPLLFFFI